MSITLTGLLMEASSRNDEGPQAGRN